MWITMLLRTFHENLIGILEHVVHPFYKPASKGSFGRLWASILLFCMIFKYWVFAKQPINPPQTMVDMTQMFLLYIFASKASDIAKAKLIPGSMTPTVASVAKPTSTPKPATNKNADEDDKDPTPDV
jgi:hypothetical protein